MRKKLWKSLRHIKVWVIIITFCLSTVFALHNSVEVKAYTAHTVDEAVSYLNTLVGKKVGSGQCVALIVDYYQYLGVPRAYGNGCDYATNTLPSGWQRIEGAQPQAGDILVWTQGSNNNGHVAICGGDNVYFHQNWDGLYVSVENKSYTNGYNIVATGERANYWGVIRPDFDGVSLDPISYEDIIPDNYFIRNKESGLYLNVAYGTDADKTQIHPYTFGNYDSQVYNIYEVDNGYEMMPLCSTTRVVNPYCDTVISGKTVNLYQRSGESSQWWKFQSANGGYIIRNVQNPNVCLTPQSNSVIVSEYVGSDSQIWRLEKACEITYDANGGTNAPDKGRQAAGQVLDLSTTVPTRSGYTFLGWSTSSAATSAEYNAGGTFTTDANTTLYAVWKKNASSTVDSWAIREEYPSQSSNAWKYYSAPLNTFPLSPYNNGNCTWYAFGRAYEVFGENPGLRGAGDAGNWYSYAQKNGMSVGSVPKAGSIICWSTHVGFVESVSGNTVTWTESNYQFNATDTIRNFKKSSSPHPETYCSAYGGTLLGYIYLNEDRPIYEEAISEGVYYLRNYATGKYLAVADGEDVNAQDVRTYHLRTSSAYQFEVKRSTTTGGYALRPLCSDSRLLNVYADNVVSGKNVCIYNDTGDGTQRWYFEEAANGYLLRVVQNPSCVLDVDLSDNAAVYTEHGGLAQMWLVQNSISYDTNGGESAPEMQMKEYGKPLTLSTTVPTRSGYTFLGWSTSSAATSAEYNAGGTFTTDANTTLYAVWKKNTTPSVSAMWGDVDNNGKVDSTDARLVLQYVVKKIPASSLNLIIADVDCDGVVNSTDARLILQYCVKKIDRLPIG